MPPSTHWQTLATARKTTIQMAYMQYCCHGWTRYGRADMTPGLISTCFSSPHGVRAHMWSEQRGSISEVGMSWIAVAPQPIASACASEASDGDAREVNRKPGGGGGAADNIGERRAHERRGWVGGRQLASSRITEWLVESTRAHPDKWRRSQDAAV